MNKTLLAEVICEYSNKSSSSGSYTEKEKEAILDKVTRQYKLNNPKPTFQDLIIEGTQQDLGNGILIGRHTSDTGCVLQFDYWGRSLCLYVGDSDRRNYDNIGMYNAIWTNPVFDISYTISNSATVTQIQTDLSQLSADGTAKEKNIIWKNNKNYYEGGIVGSPVFIPIWNQTDVFLDGCDIPNLYELAIIFLVKNTIDTLDKAKSTYLLTNTSGQGFASITEVSETHVQCISGYTISKSYKRNWGYIGIPVKEFFSDYEFPPLTDLFLNEININTLTLAQEDVFIARHKNNKGSVLSFIGFDNKLINLFVADAIYRTTAKWGTYGTDTSLKNFSENNNNNTIYIDGASSVGTQTDTPPFITIAQLRSLWSGLASDKSAKENCDVWMSYNNSTDSESIIGVPSVAYVRNLTNIFENGLDIPNKFELMSIFLCGNDIDSLDPTVDNYPLYALGNIKGLSGRKWSFNYNNDCWTSTEYNNNNVHRVMDDNTCNYRIKKVIGGVLPVKELFYGIKPYTPITKFLENIDSSTMIVTPSGRLIARHKNGKGSVIQFKITNGITIDIDRTLFVADAQYRNKSGLKWKNTATDIAGLYNHSTYYAGTNYIYNSGNVYILGATSTANQQSVASLNSVTDKQLFERFGITYTNETATYNTRSMTDLITDSPAKDYVRGLASIMSGGLDLPTALDLCVLYVEGDNIDALDPTLKSYAANALGKYTNSVRWLSGSIVWSCQELLSSHAVSMYGSGYLDGLNKILAYAVLPVREV